MSNDINVRQTNDFASGAGCSWLWVPVDSQVLKVTQAIEKPQIPQVYEVPNSTETLMDLGFPVP